MKKLSLLVGTLGGAMAGYLFSNKKLRDELANAKDADEAAKLLGAHLQRDGKKFAKQAREFVKSEEVQANLGKAKKYASERAAEAKRELDAMMKTGKKEASKAASKGAKKARKRVASLRRRTLS